MRSNVEIDDPFEKHHINGNSNIELYRLLDERSRTIKAL